MKNKNGKRNSSKKSKKKKTKKRSPKTKVPRCLPQLKGILDKYFKIKKKKAKKPSS